MKRDNSDRLVKLAQEGLTGCLVLGDAEIEARAHSHTHSSHVSEYFCFMVFLICFFLFPGVVQVLCR